MAQQRHLPFHVKAYITRTHCKDVRMRLEWFAVSHILNTDTLYTLYPRHLTESHLNPFLLTNEKYIFFFLILHINLLI